MLAETQLRLAEAQSTKARARDAALADGLSAVEKVFAINPNHALGLATRGALLLLRAQTVRDKEVGRASVQQAVKNLEQAIDRDPFLKFGYAPKLAQAKELSAAP